MESFSNRGSTRSNFPEASSSRLNNYAQSEERVEIGTPFPFQYNFHRHPNLPSSPTDTLFHFICKRQWNLVHERILFYPYDAHYRANLKTPLHLAVMHRAPLRILQLVVDAYPAALYLQDSEGWSPLHVTLLYNGTSEDATLYLTQRVERGQRHFVPNLLVRPCIWHVDTNVPTLS
jgi:ankyrin repeat protein